MSNPPAAAIRKGPNWIITGVGALLVLAIVIAVNVFAGMSTSRFDLTENHVHTLTQGTKNILERVDTPVTIKFFVSPKEVMPAQLRPYVEQTDSWLARFREINPKKITVEKLETEPATDAQEQAHTAGVEARQGMFYFGISVSCLDKTSNIDWVPEVLSNDRKEDDRIELNLAKAISEVSRTKKKKVALMSALPVESTFGSKGWAYVNELKALYDVKKIEVGATSIDEDTDVVVLIHPAGITEEAQFAIDQYLLKGGHVVAFLDAASIMAMAQSHQQQNPMMPQQGVEQSSTLSRLLPVWGYSFDTTKIVADPTYGMPIAQNLVNPVILSMGPEAIGDKDDELTKDVTSFFSVYAGAFSGSPASGLKETVFLKTSENHAMVSTTYADMNPQGAEAMKHAQELAYKLKPEGKSRLLALRLQGKFKTAFPEGKPPPPKKEDHPKGPPGGFGGFPGGGLNGIGDQGPQGPEGAPAEPGNPAAAPPTTPAATPPATPAATPPVATPPVAIPAATPPATPAATPPVATPPPATPPVTPAAAPPAAAPDARRPPITATTPPVSIPPTPAVPGTPPPPVVTPPSPLPVTPPPAKPGEQPLLPPVAGGPATPGAPAAGGALKEATHEGMVYLLGDSDMIADQIPPNMNSSNFALALGMVDQAAGDRDLLEVRARGAATRPFSALKKIIQQSNQRIQKDVEAWQADVQKAQTEIQTITSGKERVQASIQARKDLQAKVLKLNKQIYQAQKEAKKEYDGVIFGIKWKNVFLPPLLVALAGIAVFIIRRFRTAAQ